MSTQLILEGMMLKCTCTEAGTAKANEEPLCTQPDEIGLVPIEQDPLIGETPQGTLQSWLTPNSLFYVRNHYSFPTPEETNSWSLVIDGHVSTQLELTLDDFRQFPKQTLPITMECAGNNRSDLQPRVPGNPFQNGAISTAIWGGVPLNEILAKVGIKSEAVEVLFEGLDSGSPEPGVDTEPYLRSLSLDMAGNPNVLLAYEMNGEPLSLEHGYPLRLIVPGWYGMASVKWLRRMTLITEKFHGFFQGERYIIEEKDGTSVPVTDIQVKSLISWPQPGMALSRDSHNISGLAWSGSGHINRVQVSHDGGETWNDAQLVGPRYEYAWQQWNYDWTPDSDGHHIIVARAEDEKGNVQPMDTHWNRLGYVINGVKPVCVNVS
ncbi:MAG: sulfite oxidase [Chloroflexi bacterium]|nr:sulfite oxidase [Chloroflexota bacterium]MCH9037964.1 sulfite oxidase [Chloroflexota bacterium]MCI0823062.1 sulfite oxidase [Chloroflexota bacterium]MCI0841262.1 sulfite oxidase [Chloroflexota bacterium]